MQNSNRNNKPIFQKIISKVLKVIKSNNRFYYLKIFLFKYLFISSIQTLFYYLKIYFTGKRYFSIEQLNEGLARPVTNVPALSDAKIMRIASAYRSAKKQDKRISSRWINKGEWEGIISRCFKNLDAEIKNNNIDGIRKLLTNFARTDLSIGLSLSGGHPKNFREKVQQLNAYNLTFDKWKKITNSSLDQISIPVFAGNPVGIRRGQDVILIPSFRHSFYAEKISTLLLEEPRSTVLEIGGGYGGVALQLMKKPGNKHKLISVDLPEICAISAYFLMQACPEKRILLYGESDLSKEAIEQADIIIIPPFAIEELLDSSVSLVFNAHSFTEMGFATVKNYLYEIDRICTKYLLHENHERKSTYLNLKGEENIFVNMNLAEFQPCKENWKKVYRKNELIQNCLPWAGKYYEYLFLKK